jgi:hypothetical protein
MAKILVFRVDYDGCLGGKVLLHSPRPESQDYYETVCAAPEQHPAVDMNQDLLQHIRHTVQAHSDCEEIVIQIGTNRQTAFIDIANGAKHGSGSCLSAYESLLARLQTDFGSITVKLDQALLGDFESNAEEGRTFSQIQAYINGNIAWSSGFQKDAFSHAVLSEQHKLLLNYFFNQRLAEQYSGQTIWVDFIDDRDDILGRSTDFFAKNTTLCPNGITVRAVRYVGSGAVDHFGKCVSVPITVIGQYEGKGILNLDYKNKVANTLRDWVPSSIHEVQMPRIDGDYRAVITLQSFASPSPTFMAAAGAAQTAAYPQPFQPQAAMPMPMGYSVEQLTAIPQLAMQMGCQYTHIPNFPMLSMQMGYYPVGQHAAMAMLPTIGLTQIPNASTSVQPMMFAPFLQPSIASLPSENTAVFASQGVTRQLADQSIQAKNQEVLQSWIGGIHSKFVELGVLSDHQPQVCRATGILMWNICMQCRSFGRGGYNNGLGITEEKTPYELRLSVIGYNLQKFIFENPDVNTVLMQEMSGDKDDLNYLLAGMNLAREEYWKKERLTIDSLSGGVDPSTGLLTLSFNGNRDLKLDHHRKGFVTSSCRNRVEYIVDAEKNRLIVNVHAQYSQGITDVLRELLGFFPQAQIIFAGDFNRNLFNPNMLLQGVGTEPSLDCIGDKEMSFDVEGQRYFAYSAGPGNLAHGQTHVQQADGAMAIRAPKMQLEFAFGLNTPTFGKQKFNSFEEVLEALMGPAAVAVPVSSVVAAPASASVAVAAAGHGVFRAVPPVSMAAAAGAATVAVDVDFQLAQAYRQLGERLISKDIINNIDDEKYKCSFMTADPLIIRSGASSETIKNLLPMVKELFLLCRTLRNRGGQYKVGEQQEAFDKIVEWCGNTPMRSRDVIKELQAKVIVECEQFKTQYSDLLSTSLARMTI